jgi:hypothetical protein
MSLHFSASQSRNFQFLTTGRCNMADVRIYEEAVWRQQSAGQGPELSVGTDIPKILVTANVEASFCHNISSLKFYEVQSEMWAW